MKRRDMIVCAGFAIALMIGGGFYIRAQRKEAAPAAAPAQPSIDAARAKEMLDELAALHRDAAATVGQRERARAVNRRGREVLARWAAFADELPVQGFAELRSARYAMPLCLRTTAEPATVRRSCDAVRDHLRRAREEIARRP